MSTFIQEAFHTVCKESQEAGKWYVCLMERVPYYGGPEEGGWYGSDLFVMAFQEFPTEAMAIVAKEAVLKLAAELKEQSRREFGEQCLREMEWLESRGLDADFIPEPDGESDFYVYMGDEIPQESRGCRHYE